MKSQKLLFGSLIVAGAMSVVGTTQAATETGTLTVTASVSKYCSIGDGTLAFGDIGLYTTTGTGTETYASSNADASATVNVFCSKNTSGAVTFDNGLNPSSTTYRRMKSGTTNDLIPYHLYSDSGRSTEINLSGTTAYSVTGTGVGSQQSITVYGRVVRGEGSTNPAPATDYTDTVTMTITY